MRGQRLVVAAGDLANHLGCRYLTELELRALRGELEERPHRSDVRLDALMERGRQHEREYVAHLEQQGRAAVWLGSDGERAAVDLGAAVDSERASGDNTNCDVSGVAATPGASGFEATKAAMRAGVQVIVQAVLEDGEWYGRADVLLRVDTPSDLGDWSYEVVDTKLARETRGGAILQLCLYSELVGKVQGRMPKEMHVVTPGRGFERETYRVDDCMAYFRLVKRQFEAAVHAGVGSESSSAGAVQSDGVAKARDGGTAAETPTRTYPEPVAQCDVCRWWPRCDKQRRDDDHLSLVAGISKLQRREVASWGVHTLAALAKMPLPLERKPSRGEPRSYSRLREQARLQFEGREAKRVLYELLDREEERGLARLPEPSPGDIFFDIEGDAFVGEAGLEYLFGWVTLDEDGAPEYHSRWAWDAAEERTMFDAFIDEVTERWRQHPNLHVYHFGGYESGALKRLMGRYATREDEVDQLLRGGVLVDLFSVVRQGVRASVERYSIKELEPLYGFEREVELRDAASNKRDLEFALEVQQIDTVPEEVRETVRAYNRDDCVSTLHLRDWLEARRAECVAKGEAIARPVPQDPNASEKLNERQQRVADLIERLLSDVPGVPEERTSKEHQALWLLAQLLDWHRREDKVEWWEYFALAAMDEDDLLDSRDGMVGLEYVGHEGGTKRCPVHRYRFAPQDVSMKVGGDLYVMGGAKLGSVAALDLRERTIDVTKRMDTAEVHPTAIFSHVILDKEVLAKALFRLGDWVAANEIDDAGEHRAARDLLLGRGPRLPVRVDADTTGGSNGAPALTAANEGIVDAACRLGLELDDGALALQGPPGAGKTYTAAHMICALVRAGKRVGVTANGHKVIGNVLDKVLAVAGEQELEVRCIQKPKEKPPKDQQGPIKQAADNKAVATALRDGTVQVAAGTAWLWAREDMRQSVDVLFVDEAGQMKLANVLAVAQAAKSIVLIGDPQQLDQPTKGSHPDGADASALQHLLGEHTTIAENRGLFLGETWRLHPSICAFTSEMFYEGRLGSRAGLDAQRIEGDTPFAGAGLWYVPVEHEGNQNTSPEEVEKVVELYESLVRGQVAWVNAECERAPITAEDVLVVAPYNAHVSAIAERLPQGAKVGTVDKFQGQEAPVVIYAMATSSPEEAPRGMEFLYSLNRLNVATSRARCACILVASPRLLEPECHSPRQIHLANAFCRYVELAKRIESRT